MAGLRNALPTVGLFIPAVHYHVHHLGWRGASEAARKLGANLISFSGRALNGIERFEPQANILYEFVDTERLDGLIIWSGGLEWFIEPQEMEAFIKRYDTLPVVSLETAFKGIPSLLVHNYQGMRDVMAHLVEDHGYRRIAFIRGSAHHLGEQRRYQAYLDVLAKHGIPFDRDLVTPHNNWGQVDGEEAVRMLLDQRNAKFEAMVAANDEMLIGAIKCLRARGILVPDDVAAAGFDDSEEGRCMTSPLTTVPFPGYDLGGRAVEAILDLLAGREIAEQIYVPMQVILRQSCGCQSPLVTQATPSPMRVSSSGQISNEPLSTVVAAQKERIVSEMIQMLGMSSSLLVIEVMEHILESLVSELESDTPDTFLTIFTKLVHRIVAIDTSSSHVATRVALWHNVLSSLRRHILPFLGYTDRLVTFETIVQQARIIISELVHRVQARQEVQAAQRVQALRNIEAELRTTFDINGLMDILAKGLPQLGIPGCYLSLYENPQSYISSNAVVPEWSSLILAYNECGRAELETHGQVFPSRQLIPEEFLPHERRYSLEVEALYFQDEQIGCVLFEEGPSDGTVYQTLQSQISNALQGAILMQRVRERTTELAAAYGKINLLNKQLTSENLRMGAELDVARHLQQMVLPRHEELQQIEGLDVVGFMQPADEIGGDYYDIFSCSNGQLCIGIGDVTGHGLESGVLVLMTQTVVRTLSDRGKETSVDFLNALNRVLSQNIQRMRMEKTLTFAFVKHKDRRVTLMGQHEVMLVVRKNGHVELVDTVALGFPIGLVEDISDFVDETSVSLEVGDGIVLYTDGITEAQNSEGEIYGLERLCETIGQHWGGSAEATKTAVIDDVIRYIGTQKIYDDLTLIVLKQQ